MQNLRSLFVGLILAQMVLLACSGCASYLSESSPPGPVKDGLVYYMPKRPIDIQVVVTTDATTKTVLETPSLPIASAIPDLSKRFVLSDQNYPIGENHVTFGVSTNGLLKTQNSTATSGVGTILQNLATAAADLTIVAGMLPMDNAGVGTEEATYKDTCNPGHTYNMLVSPPTLPVSEHICGYSITIQPAFDSSAAAANASTAGTEDNSNKTASTSGIFYKTELPYLVTLTPINEGNAGSSITFIAYSPDAAPISLLPIKRTVFAKNTVAITMADGEVTSFDQDNTGELVGLATIPADVIGAYFSAVSKIIPQEISAQNSQSALALSEAQRQICATALVANPIKSNQTPTDQAAALANIKTACSSSPAPSAQ